MMTTRTTRGLKMALLGAAASLALTGAALAQTRHFDIPSQDAAKALQQYALQSGRQVLFPYDAASGRTAPAIRGDMAPDEALALLAQSAGLRVAINDGDTVTLRRADQGPQAASAGDVDALIVTAQKKEENIQDVPIAISAFSQESLDAQKIEGGFDLLKAIPNVTFSKNNFSSYNFSIRGIGTKAISVATDPGVAVEFNDTPLIRNRLFEQEYFDLERVEVLRGPQGTLHGRNATAGVINVISKKADLDSFEGRIKGEVGNYHTKRLSGVVNVPLIEDVLAIRFAGAMTDRAGYDYNSITNHAINGRDLWSGRLSLGFEPSERLRADLIWERFNEDDDRSRTGKQLCHRDQGPTVVGSTVVPTVIDQAALSQGCRPGSLYDDGAFGTPNGLSMPHMLVAAGGTSGWQMYFGDNPGAFSIVNPVDPYGGMRQSTNLREIASIFDPIYRAKADILELNVSFDVSDMLTITSQTAYNEDAYYSTQDFNRFNSYPVFRDTSGDYRTEWGPDENGDWVGVPTPTSWREAVAGGIYCDPQLGCSDTIAGMDMSRAKSSQFSQELRIQSSFDGRFNFSAGANYTRYRTVEDYFVFFNVLTAVAEALNWSGSSWPSQQPHYQDCVRGFFMFGGPGDGAGCIYVDPNPIESFNGEGHNYFRSKNPYVLTSAAMFGEIYWNVTEAVKLTAGLRYTDDKKVFRQVPSQLLLSTAPVLSGTVDRGYPEAGELKQHWGEFSGRIGFDWTPDLALTDQTMLYAFYSRGYKGGGANPPGIGFRGGADRFAYTPGVAATFDPEFVNAYEIGVKNTLLGGAMVLNFGAFYYDYKDYQVSKIIDRTAANENYDAKIWGFELESVFRPSKDLRLNMNFGYQDTKIAEGSRTIDVMNRLQGAEGYAVVKPFVQLPSNCVVPIEYIEGVLNDSWQPGTISEFCPGIPTSLGNDYDLAQLPNGGLGFYDDVSGNELPNAPHWTVSVGAEYGWDLFDGSWRATVRGDAYWQSQSWARVHNAVNDKLHGWWNTNLSLWLERPEDDLKIEVYVKNALDDTPITDAFLNSDDTSLTTNVFILDPRLIGLSITKGF